MEQTLLFIGAMLVAFQYVGDIGYASSLFALPFALPIKPLLKKVGLTIVWAIPLKAKWEITKPTSKRKLVKFYIVQVGGGYYLFRHRHYLLLQQLHYRPLCLYITSWEDHSYLLTHYSIFFLKNQWHRGRTPLFFC